MPDQRISAPLAAAVALALFGAITACESQRRANAKAGRPVDAAPAAEAPAPEPKPREEAQAEPAAPADAGETKAAAPTGTPLSASAGTYVYPPAERGDLVEEYHGVKVSDPYRWLENPDSPKSRAWIDAENVLTESYLAGVPQRSAIRDRLTSLWNYERFGIPFKEGGKYFYTRNDGLQNQSVLFVADAIEAPARVLLDPNALSRDGTVAIAGTSVSEDGKYLAWGVAEAGSDWNVWRVREIATGKDLGDELKWVKFTSASWTKDNAGFFYSRFDEPKYQGGAELRSQSRFQKIAYHRVGTPQSQDALIYERPDQPDWYIGGGVTDDGKYLVINISDGNKIQNGVFFRAVEPKDAPVVELLGKFDAQYEFVGNEGPVFYFKTDLGAPRWRIVAIDTRSPEAGNWKEVIPQSKDVMQGVSLMADRFIVQYLSDAKAAVKVYAKSGAFERNVDLPAIGSAGGFGGRQNETETFYSFTSFTSPGAIYRYDIPSGKSTLFKQPKVNADLSAYITEQVFYQSKDGTKVPMFITHKSGITLDGNNPTMLYGYGGFDISVTPWFSPSTLTWLEMGGVYAVANLRGGGEYGSEWHEAGTKLRKQNVFDDFIAAGEYLVAKKYTSPAKLAINGGSNGGLLVGACLLQRPDLFGAAVPQVGVLDMLRFHKFTVGWGWVADYGSSDDAEMFPYLLSYSPYHNILRGKCYPPTFITTADHDDRVVPAHSFKFAAALQYGQGCGNPILIRIETRAGHGAGKPTTKRIEEAADMWAFVVRALGMKDIKVGG